MIVRHFIRVPVGSTVYCDNQPVKILEKGYALALCDVNGKRVYITCYDLEKKPFVSTDGEISSSLHDYDANILFTFKIIVLWNWILTK